MARPFMPRLKLSAIFDLSDRSARSLGSHVGAGSHMLSLHSSLPEGRPAEQEPTKVPPYALPNTCLPTTSFSVLPACSWQASSAVESSLSPVSEAIHGFSSLQAGIGLPWWATLALLATGIRVVLLPLTIQQIRSSAANFPLMQLATKRVAQKMATGVKAEDNRWKSWLRQLHSLRQQSAAPSLLWIIAAPLLQIPVFVTALMAVRSMSCPPWPGFENGGLLWFKDLSQPALSFDTIAAPMGTLGIILPAAMAGLTFANVQQIFSRGGGSGRQSELRPLLIVQLVLEWLIVPLFLVALQLPQAVLVYWCTSSAVALAQARVLRTSYVQEALSLQRKQADTAMQEPTARSASGTPLTKMPATALEEALASTDVAALFNQAAEWKAAGHPAAAVRALEQILVLDSSHSRAWFALGQTLAGLKAWQQAGHAYTEAASLESDSVVLARAWFGAGIAAYHDNDPEGGLQALRKAVNVALTAINHQKLQHVHVRPADPLLFTAGKLQRESVWAAALSNAGISRELSAIAVRALFSQGSILKQQGKFEQARAAMEHATVVDPNAVGPRVGF